ncbi:MAG: FAD-dependent oxidoreductase [Sporocytophaga sp.]|nr:FAD-dependent oxidoreductase [Sporocytophaga sp.]
MNTDSIWKEESGKCEVFAPLEKDIETEVLIIGGGITGLTLATLLNDAGINSVLAEASRIGNGTTGMSSCHLTTQIDTQYSKVYKDFGEKITEMVARSRTEGINFIEQLIDSKNIDCDFKRVAGYQYADKPEQIADLEKEYRNAGYVDLPVELTETVDLPFPVSKALKFDNQAVFNAQAFINGLAEQLVNSNCKIFENTRVTDIREDRGIFTVTANGSIIRALKVVMATQIPLFFNVLQTLAFPYISYVIAARIEGDMPQNLYWDMDEPYHYIRSTEFNGQKYLIVGGADHKVGHEEDTSKRFTVLESYTRKKFNVQSIDFRWSAEFYESADGLPFIGESPFSKNLYVATGFSGDGLVYGPLAALIINDLIKGKTNKYYDAYDSKRISIAASMADFFKENIDNVRSFVADKFGNVSEETPGHLAPGEGKILNLNGEKVAVAKDANGEVHAVSPVCTHLKCNVHFNNAEQTWDCPCHGSRFSIDGSVMYGPAVDPLEKKEIIAVSENKK